MAGARKPLVRLQPLLLGIGFALLIAISGATLVLVNRASTDSEILAQRIQIQDALSNVLLAVRRAESGQRGYLYTDNEAYLDDFREAGPEARKLINGMQTLARTDPRRQGVLKQVATLVDDKFNEMSRAIALNRDGRVDEARGLVATGQGRALMATIRTTIEEAIQEEGRVVDDRIAQSRENSNLLLILSLLGALLIVAVGAVSVVLTQRNVRAVERARNELELTNANLEEIVAHRTADLTEANEEIQRFAYIVSHDLRSPLVNVMGFTSELEALRQDIFQQVEKLKADLAALNPAAAEGDAAPIEQLGQDFDEAIRFIKTSIGNMDRLINAVLKLSREGRRQFSPQIVDVPALMEAIVENVTHRAAELGATITLGTLPPVESDRLALEQIFSNLVDNALKYGRDDASLEIAVSGRIAGGMAIYDVADNGRGIDARDHQRVFELFRRSGTQDRPGEGIGLAHVRALVRRMGGTMSLRSELGRGSTFTVTLPQRWSVEKRSAA